MIDLNFSFSQEIISTIQTESNFHKVKIQDNIVYAVTSYGLETYDIANKSNPIKLSACPTPGDAINLDINSEVACIAELYGGLTIVDISDPENLRYISSFQPPKPKYGPAVKVEFTKIHENIVYLSTFTGLYAVDISDAYNPVLTHRLYFEENGMDDFQFFEAAIKGNRMYVTNTYSGLSILDISEPSNPIAIKSIELDYLPEFLEIEENILYGAGFGSFLTLDISGKDTACLLGISPNLLFFGGAVRDMDVNNALVAIPLYGSVWLADASDPENIDSLSLITDGYQFVGCAFEDSNLVICRWDRRLDIWNVVHPENPYLLSNYSQAGHVTALAKTNDYIYAKAGDSSLWIIDVNNPYDPIFSEEIMIGFKDLYTFRDVCINEKRLFIANDSHGINYYDIQNPAKPTLIDKYFEPGERLINLASKDNLLAVGAPNKLIYIMLYENILSKSYEFSGDSIGWADLGIYEDYLYGHNVLCFEIYDISNHMQPTRLSTTCYGAFVISDIVIFNDRAYIALGDAGIDIFDIADKSNPIKIKRWPEEWESDKPRLSILGIKKFEEYLILFDGVNGIIILNISERDNPRYILNINTPGMAVDGIVDSSYIYVADTYGITIIKHNLIDIPVHIPEDHRLLSQNYPNPFNSSTVIEYAVPYDGHVVLDVYNILGQKVTNLVDGYRRRGDHTVLWDGKNSSGRDCASGIYFCKLKTGGYEGTRTMVMVR